MAGTDARPNWRIAIYQRAKLVDTELTVLLEAIGTTLIDLHMAAQCSRRWAIRES